MGRILVIEDEPSARLLLQSRLEDLGHEVATAPTGAMGLMEARAGRFDLFLVDVVLGAGVDGYEVTRRLKAMPQTHGVPVVMVSEHNTGREDLHRGYEAGCEAFLIKGDMTLLEDVVRAMLRIKALQNDLSLQNRLLEDHNRRLHEEQQRGADLELALRESGARALVFRELAAGRPDGVLVVDGDGIVREADRGARELFGNAVEGAHLGSLAPATGLEAYVRDARTEPREGFRFDLPPQTGRGTRSVTASVVPTLPAGGVAGDPGLRVVLLLDAGKRRVAAELLRMQEQGIPRRETAPLIEAAREIHNPSSILGAVPEMVALRAHVAREAVTDDTVLIRGERGVGKQHVARALHFGGSRSGPFVPVSCGGFTPSVLESELFGHAKGAFTGAFADRPGLFHQAHMGTVFLADVDELSLDLQAKLVQVLEKSEVGRVGAPRCEQVDVRVIAATGADLGRAVAAGRFRDDLLQLLGGVDLEIPPLRARIDDLPLLARHFLGRYGASRATVELAEETLWALENHDWPGNVRELRQCIERACALTEGDVIGPEDLAPPLRELARRLAERSELPPAPRIVARPGAPETPERAPHPRPRMPEDARPPSPAGGAQAEEEVEISFDFFERKALLLALERTGGDKLKAAKLLAVGKSTLYRKLKRHGIQ